MIIDKNYQLKINALYLNQTKEFKKFIYLLYNNNHFHLIKSMKSYLNRSYFCDFCKAAFNTINRHFCKYLCKGCKRDKYECINNNLNLYCDICFLSISNSTCMSIHKKIKN